MTLPKLSKVTIDGIDVTSYVFKWEVPKAFNQSGAKAGKITKGYIWLNKNIKNVLTMTETLIGVPIIIQRGVTSSAQYYVFRGSVVKSNIEGAYLKVDCKDRLQEAINSQVTYSYDKTVDTAQAGKISEIFKDLINTYTDLYADNNSVQDSGTAFTLDKFICNNENVHKKCEELAKVLDWQFYYKPSDDTVYFEPKGYVNSDLTLTVGTNIVKVPRWRYDSANMVNVVKIFGSEVELETTESGQIGVTSGWTEDEVSLSYTPQSVKVYLDAADPPTTLKEGGITGVTSGTFHYTVDADEKKVLFESGVASDNDYCEIRYSFFRQIPIVSRSNQSITDYRMQKEISIVNDQLLTQSDTEEFARRYIQKYKDPFVYTKLRVIDIANLEVGQTIRIVDNVNGEDRNLLISTIKMKYPYTYDEVEVGDKIPRTSDWFVNTLRKIQSLERKNLRDDDILNHLEDMNPTNIFESRYLKLDRKNLLTNTTLIWGSAALGIWKYSTTKFNWGDDYVGDTDLVGRMIPGNMAYKEFFYDNDFKDTTNTTATWDTGNRVVTATKNKVVQTEPFYFNNVSINRINLKGTRARNYGSMKFVINTKKNPNGQIGLILKEGYGA